jgi:oligopeptide/dipeptide ABC transporter ATP-binding protein
LRFKKVPANACVSTVAFPNPQRDPLAPPPGCSFHPRCPHADERCRRERPELIDAVACHAVQEGRISFAR